MPGLSYDESGSLASYFALTFLSLTLIPTTLLTIKRSLKTDVKGKECDCVDCRRKVESMRKGKGGRREGKGMFSKRILLLSAGWVLFSALVYYLKTTDSIALSNIYDPFEILGLSSSADEKAIKKHYKRISLQFHPDKIKLSENQTQEDADAHFVELTKAYKSLTDESIRENLRLYGNPDGVQPREEKIAIPSWVIEGNGGLWTLLVYGLIGGGGLPWLVGRWWFSQKSITKDGVLNSTAELIFRELKETTTFPQLVTILSSAHELPSMLSSSLQETTLKSKSSSKKDRKHHNLITDELEKKILAKASGLGLGDVLEQGDLGNAYGGGMKKTAAGRRAKALIWSQLVRVDDLDTDLLKERQSILLATPTILQSALQISLAHHWLSTSLLVMRATAQLVQGLPNPELPIAQLPGMTLEQAKENGELSGMGWQRRMNVGKGEEKRGGEQGKVAEELPVLEVNDVFFQVDDEPAVTPASTVQFTFDALLNVANTEPSVNGTKGQVNNIAEGYAHAPRWPDHRKPTWWVLVGDPISNKVVVQPRGMADLPIKNGDGVIIQSSKEDSTSDDKKQDSGKGKTLKLPFSAPPEPNEYKLEAYWISDTWVGCDLVKPIILKVDPVSETTTNDNFDDDDDISEPDEDTLAGAIAVARGQKTKQSSARQGEGADDASDDDESGSEIDVGNDSSSDSDSD